VTVLLGLCAAFLWSGALATGWISEDASVVRHVASHGGLADWFDAQYGMSSIRFWRPLVSTSYELQLALHGPDPAALRLANLAAHFAGALLLALLARALGCGDVGALVAGLAALLFPHQGGTAIWIVGRVDAFAWPLVVAAALAAAHGRAVLVGLFVLLALATKEVGAAAVPMAAAAAVLAPDLAPRLRRRALVAALVGGALAVGWRALALGTLVGGYPGTSPFAAPFASLQHGFTALGTLPVVMAFTGLLALLGRSYVRAGVIVGGVGCLAALAIVSPLLAQGVPRPEHLRWMVVADGCLCLMGGALVGRLARCVGDPVRLVPAAGATLLLAAACVWRGLDARADVLSWSRAGAEAEAFASGLDAAVRAEAPRPEPVFAVDVPRLDTLGRAYTLHLGLADRFRAPLADPAPREVWPWRPLHASTPELPPPAPVRGGLWRPEEAGAVLAHVGPAALVLRGADSGGVRFAFADPALGVGARVVLVTEVGYDMAPLVAREGGWSAEDLLGATGATELWRTLLLASDFGARRALFALVAADGRSTALVPIEFDDATVAVLASVR
jgi:hypothetical protein